MQRSMASMVGLPVETRMGVRLGEIRDAWMEPTEHRLLAFDVEWGPTVVLNRDEPLPVTDMVELTADVATVADEIGTSTGLDRDFPLGGDGLLRALDHVVDMPVYDADGERLGVVVDVHFDPQDGSVRYYELAYSDDPDQPDGVKLLMPHHDLEFRDHEALVVPATAMSGLRSREVRRVDVAMLDFLGIDEPQGDEDVEVMRGRPLAEP